MRDRGYDYRGGPEWDREGYGRTGGYGRTADLYREGGLTREGRQIASQQAGSFVGRGPRGYQRSDERIREDVCEALFYHGGIDASDVDVQVQGGEVTLTGTVQDRRQKRLVEDALDGISGVRDVHNQVRVQQRAGQERGWSENDLARTGQTTTDCTTRSATGGAQVNEGVTGASPALGREAQRAGTNARGGARGT